jgi:N-methylhydantoinase B
VRVAFKYLIATGEPANEGTFRPVKMILPEGKLISAEATAAMGLYSIPFPTVIDCIIKALEPALPERVTGAHFGTFSSLSFGGRRIDTGAFFKANDSGHGGWGACATHDGAGPFRTMAHGDTRLIPIELQESMYPIRVEEFRLRQDSGGPGRWRGGLGFEKQYFLLAPCELWANFDRIGCPPWGVQGAKAGKAGQVLVIKNGKQEAGLIYKTENCPVQVGDRVRMSTGGGGGYGDPRERDDARRGRFRDGVRLPRRAAGPRPRALPDFRRPHEGRPGLRARRVCEGRLEARPDLTRRTSPRPLGRTGVGAV